MAEGKILPYLDVPFQHASPRILKLMKRPASAENNLERIRAWREACPELTIRSTFIAGFPGETEAEFEELLRLPRRSAARPRRLLRLFAGRGRRRPTSCPAPCRIEVREERRQRLMEFQEDISTQRLERKIGREIDRAGRRSRRGGRRRPQPGDAPEIDGLVHIPTAKDLEVGEFARVRVTDCDVHDLYAELGRG
jgi:ribosomal protein S12 methylthiotransferase